MKKLIFLITVAISIFLSGVLSPMLFAESKSDPNPDELNKVSDYVKAKGTMGNVKNLYTTIPASSNKTKSTGQFLGHDLIFPIKLDIYENVKTELKDSTMASYYKDKEVSVFGVKYMYQCYLKNSSNNKDNMCMYGGVTENQNNISDKPIKVVVSVTTDKSQTFSFDVSTNKLNVTAQELDYKVRKYLTEQKDLYKFDGSAYETGYIKFIEKDGNSFWYDLFPSSDLVPFEPSKFLMIYKDNKTVDASKTHIEVHLTTN